MNSTLSSSPVPHLRLGDNRLVFIGMMGSGKTSVGHRVAVRLGVPFYDSDAVLESAHGITVADYFAQHGEAAFRQEEQKTIAALLEKPSCVISLGGGAFMNEATRNLIKARAISIWLRAGVDMLLERALRHNKRPLLQVADPRARMLELLAAREGTYALADLVVDSDNRPVDVTAARVEKILEDYIATRRATVSEK